MALVPIAQHTPLQTANPTASLADALKEFESILSNEQKLVYRSNYAKPEAADVLAFVSRIDADNKGRAQRCVAPRLCTFLNSAVQFTNVVDTFVSSNPSIAALVWGSIKTTMLAASNIASYFDKVTGLVMQIGRTTPTFKLFGELYPASAGLQTTLCEYYAIVVRLSIKIIQVSQRSALTQAVSPIFNPFESEFKTYVDNITQAAKDIEIQVSLASKQALRTEAESAEAERKENSAHRRMMLKLHKGLQQEADERRLQKEARALARLRRDVLDGLSSLDHTTAWRQAKSQMMPGTAQWFAQASEYQAWTQKKDTSLLMCVGTMGSGKTTLISNMISHIMTNRSQADVVAYFFCRFHNPESLLAKNVLASLCRQLLVNRIDTMDKSELTVLQTKIKQAGDEDLLEAVSPFLSPDANYYIVLDGLDECDAKELKVIGCQLSMLGTSQTPASFKVLCAGRNGLARKLCLHQAPHHLLSVDRQVVDDDISMYVKTTLAQRQADGIFIPNQPDLVREIADVLTQKSNGMFLWARLILEEICEQESTRNVRKALETAPKELSVLFEMRLQRIRGKSSVKLLIRILQLCGITRRPLSPHELGEVLAVKLGQTSLDHEGIPHDINQLIDSCCGLVHADEENFGVHFVHHSVHQYLFGGFSSQPAVFDYQVEDQQFGLLCLTYLNFTDFDQQLKMRSRQADLQLALVDIGVRPIADNARSTKFLRQVLQHVPKNHQQTVNIQKMMNQMQNMIIQNSKANKAYSHFHFLEYAKQHWIFHLKLPFHDEQTQTVQMFRNCVAGTNTFAHRPWEISGDNTNVRSPNSLWRWVVRNQIGVFVQSSLGLLPPEQAPLVLLDACVTGKKEFANLILSESRYSSNCFRPFSAHIAFPLKDLGYEGRVSSAAIEGLLNQFPEPLRQNYFDEALIWAIKLDQLYMVCGLLEASLDFDYKLKFDLWAVLVRHAIATKRQPFLRIFMKYLRPLHQCLDTFIFDTAAISQGTPAEIYSTIDVVSMRSTDMLDRSLRIHVCDHVEEEYYSTILMRTLDQILARGAHGTTMWSNTNTGSTEGIPALFHAVLYDNANAVKMLLDDGAPLQYEIADRAYENPSREYLLYISVSSGRQDAIVWETNLSNESSAFLLAIHHGQRDMLRVMVEWSATRAAVSNDLHITVVDALIEAVLRDEEEVVDILLDVRLRAFYNYGPFYYRDWHKLVANSRQHHIRSRLTDYVKSDSQFAHQHEKVRLRNLRDIRR